MLKKISFPGKGKNSIKGLLIGDVIDPDESSALIVCHGFSGSKEGGGKAISMGEYLSHHNITTLLFDFSGNGESDGKFEDITLSGQVEDLFSAVKFMLSLGFKKIFIMGRSFGGTTAICFQGHHKVKNVCGIICVNSVAMPYELFSRFIYKKDGEIFTLKGDGKEVRVKNTFFNDLKKWDVISMVKNLSPTPILIIQGDRDNVVDPNQTHILYKNAREPKELFIIKNGDHTLTNNYRPMWDSTLNFILSAYFFSSD